ncbi:MAG: peptidylprolyl isomerase [Treponema sp.]|jgi:parvulin-like peptidyl-prolyl isomerase|nr:peptidylprolyl isomerase [Treponema sp.]
MKRALFLIIAASFLTVAGFAQADLQPVAIVNLVRSEPITMKHLRAEVETTKKAAGRELTQSERQQVLDKMINERLILQAAERDKISITENEVNQRQQQYRSLMAQRGGRQPTDAEFAQAIKEETGFDLPAFREQLRRQMIAEKYIMTKKESLFASIKVPAEEDIRSAYELAKKNFTRDDTVRVSMIMVPYGQDAAAKTKARELADKLSREINSNPSKFDDVSLRAQAPASGYQAGDAGYLPHNAQAQQLVGKEFVDTAFSLQQGAVSKIIEGKDGYQIIKITETYGMKFLELDDIAQLGTRVTVRDYIGNSILQQRQASVVAQATQELVNELRAGKTFQVIESNLKW